MVKRNLTVQLDDEIIRQAKVLAARRGTSVSAMMASELERMVVDDDLYDAARERALQALDAARQRGGRSWKRDDLYRT